MPDIPFDQQLAISYGQLVNLVYAMSGGDGLNLTPAYPGFPGFKNFIGWVQMQDFSVLGKEIWKFYGIIVQADDDPDKFVLVIRGTEGFYEWYDDIASVKLIPVDTYNVGDGFEKIFATMKVVKKDGTSAAEFGTFEKQVASTAKEQVPSATEAAINLIVCGHSLGAALATLYVAKNAKSTFLQTPLLCTFASPRVGDQTFVDFVDALPISSWKIVNEVDWVPKVPFKNLGFEDIKGEKDFWSSEVMTNPPCNHFMNTYLYLLGVPNVLDFECDVDQQPGPHWQTS